MNKDSRFSRLLIQPEVYRIRVCGRLGPEWSERLGGMVVSVVLGKSSETISELFGQLSDQAALMGVLQQLNDNCIPILSLECLREGHCDE